MSNNRDDNNKDPLRKGDPKRPHATLDLKAVEIKSSDKKAADAVGGAKSATQSASASGSNPVTGTKSTSNVKSTLDEKSVSDNKTAAAAKSTADTKTTPEVKSGVTSGGVTGAAATFSPSTSAGAKQQTGTDSNSGSSNASGGSSSAAAASGKSGTGSQAKPPPPAARQGGGGFGRVLSHTFAGLVGGFLALIGADTLAPQLAELGLPVGQTANHATKELSNRLAALEKSVTTTTGAEEAGSAKLTAAIDGISQRVASLEQLPARVKLLGETQQQLKADADALATRVAKAPAADGASTPDPRIAKLEERLALLSSASNDGNAASAVPQLAAVTGKISDLEETMGNQLDALRKNVGQEIDARISKATEAAQAARSGTTRIDRELADVKTGTVRLGQRLDALKAENDKVGETVRAVQEKTGGLASSVESLKADLTTKFNATAKPQDVAQAIEPVSTQLATLEKNLAGVINAEENRKANAGRIVLSLELANLKRVIDRGLGYADELAQVKKAAPADVDLSALEPYKSDGVPTLATLKDNFRPLTHRMIAAAADTGEGGVFDRLLSEARSVIRVRKVDHSANDESVEAVVARMDAALDQGRFGDFQALADKLPEKVRAPAVKLFSQVAARGAVDKAVKQIESQLKSSLGGAQAPSPAPAIQ